MIIARNTRVLLVVLLLTSSAATAEAQLIDRIRQRAADKVTERRERAEESVVEQTTQPVDSALEKVAAPVDSAVARAAGGVSGAIAGMGRSSASQRAEKQRIETELASNGRAGMPGILFDPGSPELHPASEPALEALLSVMRGSGGSWLVEGRGDAGSEQELGAARAKAVKEWLLDLDETLNIFATIGAGPGDPVSVARLR